MVCDLMDTLYIAHVYWVTCLFTAFDQNGNTISVFYFINYEKKNYLFVLVSE